jgi:Xaa-Pro aminopeptidase
MIFILYGRQLRCHLHSIFYLSGADQEESILLFPDAPYEHQREMIFLKPTNTLPFGKKLTKERAYEVTGIKTVYWLQD